MSAARTVQGPRQHKGRAPGRGVHPGRKRQALCHLCVIFVLSRDKNGPRKTKNEVLDLAAYERALSESAAMRMVFPPSPRKAAFPRVFWGGT